jgi:CheY-like chemotaxis protein
VQDSGSGMAPDVVARAFEPFFTTKEVGRGTGLGLSMVYGFAKQSDGHVRIYSEVGMGTVVRLYLPRADAAPAILDIMPQQQPELERGSETVLLVEDDPLVRRHAEALIASLGYEVIAAEHGGAALARVEEGCVPDLLFTDMVMPGINGRELARKLRERWPNLPVLYSSGYAHGTLTDDDPLPAKYILGKPYRRRELAERLRDVLDEPPA